MADLLYNAVLEKYAEGDFDEVFEFDGIIPESTTVTDKTVTVTRDDGVDVTDSLVSAVSHSGTTVTVSIHPGTTETAYAIKVVVTASDLSQSVMLKLLNVVSAGVYR